MTVRDFLERGSGDEISRTTSSQWGIVRISFHVVQVQLKMPVIKNDTDRRPKRKTAYPQYEDSYISSVGHPRIEFGGFFRRIRRDHYHLSHY